ncbi:MmpS family transport accessory protein [Streptacidiphilus melanogenes]|uniref:MmpS family transport accessory protein n=1 Tax=Streptacidiphilus melanogenes TaxID=411235 RepID=UPI0005A623AB|nr:MmpS family transport accessory protein [Streptacidiphilus melanogenes]
MKSAGSRTYVTSLLVAGASALAAVLIAGCGLFGKSWDVKMEVTGPGTTDVSYSFSGETDPKTAAQQRLPWTRAQNVGFGFNDLGVKGAAPGTICRIYVDGKLKDQQKPDARGNLTCSVNVQN